MFDATSLKGAQHLHEQAAFGTSREREFFRYLPSYHHQTHTLQHIDQHTLPSDFVARPSPDAVLAAFAQLGAFRLDAKRALISLFGRHGEHILAEATRTLSLQDATEHNPRDGIWMGSCVMSYGRSFNRGFVNTASDQLLVIPDLTEDEEFKRHEDVLNYPNIRFLASNPIISPKGMVIGAYTVLDDRPHKQLDTDLKKFLADISHTVMDYLDATMSKNQHHRSERMVVGLGSFLEGKGSLRNSWINDTNATLSPGAEDNVEGHINEIQQEKQMSDDVAQATTRNPPLQRPLPLGPRNLKTPRDQKPTAQNEQPHPITKSKTNTRSFAKPTPHPTTTISDRKTNKKSSKEIYSAQVKEAFSRAANIARESIEVETTVFFDANLGSQEAVVDFSKSDSDISSVEGYSSGDDGAKAQRTFTQRGLLNIAHAEHAGKGVINPCRILGFSTSDVSSINDQALSDKRIVLSEEFLGHLLQRYPRGKIFNFGEDGSISSDETSDGVFKDFLQRSGGKAFKKTRKATARQDAATLLQLAPNARSIVFSPLWDSHKERWYAGCLSWTQVPYRVLTSNDELTFLFAFGNCVMAEVHRLGALLSERAKVDLLAGISHELRSPLHGIFGMVDILSGTEMEALQQDYVHAISSCATTLLGSIDQLLEYASINDVRPNHQPLRPFKRAKAGVKEDPKPREGDEDFGVQFDFLLEDAMESSFAGYSFGDFTNQLEGSPSHSDPDTLQDRVWVILDINHAQSFSFSTQPGVWHVILTNIIGNALKFTKEGYIHVSLKTTPVKFGSDGQATRSKVKLTVHDTGCGIEQDFLRNELSTAFTQENTLLAGNGLGFNITRRLVSSLSGDIQVKSQKGVGTEVTTTVTLDHSSGTGTGFRDSPNSNISLMATRPLISGKMIGIFGSCTSDGDIALHSSLQKLCQDWFQTEARSIAPSDVKSAECDVYILPHESLDEVYRREIASFAGASTRLSPPVIVICSSPRVARSMFLASRRQPMSVDVFEFISQPCGPRKLAKTLEVCLTRQQRRADLVQAKGGLAAFRASVSLPLTPYEFDRKSFLQPLNSGGDESIANVQHSSEPTESLEPIREDRSASEEKQGFIEAELSPHPNLPTTVLIVDDNDINVKLLVAYMKKSGYPYFTAHDGETALELFKENAFEIIAVLMDLSMPVMDGFESTQRMREFEKTLGSKKRTFICALTGVAQVDTERKAIGSGMDMFLAKPVRLDKLRQVIENNTSITSNV